MRWALVALLPPLLLAFACGGGGAKQPTATPTARLSGPPYNPQAVEADDDPNLPGEYVNLPEIYDGYYGNHSGIGTNTGAHKTGPIDYSAQGLPPAGGPHWGSARCPPDPAQAPPDCGPVPWGIYRAPWPAESLVHNMEHAGVIIWYHTSDQNVINKLEDFTQSQLRAGKMLVLVPYPDMEPERIAITVWSRRDEFSVSKYSSKRLQHFIDVLYCRFDPEHFCHQDGGLTVSTAASYHPSAL
jgi:hypothetical protein